MSPISGNHCKSAWRRTMKLKTIITLLLLWTLSHQVAAQDSTSCGELPVEPDIVDGASSTVEQLVANSEAVNAYIAEADQFLDCSEDRYKRLSSSRIHKDRIGEQIKTVTARRNEIGAEFNAQVAAYKAANPQ